MTNYAAAARCSDIRPLTEAEAAEEMAHREWMRTLPLDAFEPFRLRLISGDVLDGPDHAVDGDRTLCGIPASDFVVMRHLFMPGAGPQFACPECVARL